MAVAQVLKVRQCGRRGEHDVALLEAPLADPGIDSLTGFLGHKGEQCLAEVLRRQAGLGPDFYIVALYRDEPVSHLWRK